MKNTQKYRALKQTGMTLVEIMIVLVIIAGLASVLITQVNSQLKKARVNEAKILIKEMGKSLDMYLADCGNYPEPDVGLDELIEDSGSCSNWGPDPYLKRLPKDPWNSDLVYDVDGGDYILVSLGADRREGGSGFDKDISSDDL